MMCACTVCPGDGPCIIPAGHDGVCQRATPDQCQWPGPGGLLCRLPWKHEGPHRWEISLDELGSAGGPLMAAHADRLAALLSEAEKVIVFAVARLDVLTYPGWPHEALRALGEHYKSTAGDDDESQRKRELGLIWLDFAKEAESWERSRAEGTHKLRLQAENLMRPAVSLLQHRVPEQVVKSTWIGRTWAQIRAFFSKK